MGDKKVVQDAALSAGPTDDNPIGLSVDMLDADRLAQWAINIDRYGSNLAEWTDRRWLVNELQRLSKAVADVVRDVGVLRGVRDGRREEPAK